MSPLLKTCVECGEPSVGARCDDHPWERRRKQDQTAPERGYDTAWRKLSLRARRLQPWCSDCGTGEDLTGDHLPIAWERKAKGLPIRLKDIDVVCRACNNRRGAARGPGGRGQEATPATPDDRSNSALTSEGDTNGRA